MNKIEGLPSKSYSVPNGSNTNKGKSYMVPSFSD